MISNHRELAFLDSNFLLRSKLSAPDGWHFCGHGVCLEPQKIVVSARPSQAIEPPLEGKLLVIDTSQKKVIEELSAGGFDPHDMILMQDGSLAVANYGDRRKSDLNDYRLLEPKLNIFDANSLKLKESFDAPRIGALSHISEGPNGLIAGIPARLQLLSEEALESAKNLTGGRDFSVSAAEMVEGKIGFPSPILTFDRKSGEWRSFLVDPFRQRRPQSITFHQESQCWFVTYPFSEHIVRLSIKGDLKIISAFDLGLSFPRGICARSGDSSVYVGGQYRGVAQINAESMVVERRWDIQLYDATHLYFI